jgi:anti-sigma factor ChrR (cupin superfamily)
MNDQLSNAPSWTLNAATGIQGPVRGSLYHSTAAQPWQPTAAEGFWIKPLFEDAERGEKTLLMKIDPGAFVGSHTHEGEQEQLYVLEGSMYDHNGTLNAGDYCCRSPDSAHSAGSEHGAIVLLIYTHQNFLG